MKKCIICRKNKVEFSDEHVIPDSIKGYYHIYTVCIKCNSWLGENIDETITNHKFMEFQRYTMRIPGKKGKIPNPFDGIHSYKDETDIKVKLQEDKLKRLTPYILPNISSILNDSFSIQLDKKDEKDIDKIVNKILKRNGIPKEKVSIVRNENGTIYNPIEIKTSIDIEKFKMGLLKIGYEFATDTIKNYFSKDIKAKTISNLLYNADYDGLNKHNLFIGDGFQKEIMHPFEKFIDFKGDFHYLILVNDKKYGLICYINLFNTFFIGIHLSNKEYYIPGSIIFGINDTFEKKFKKISLEELMNSCYSEANIRFKYYFNNVKEELNFTKAQSGEEFKIFNLNGEIPLFNSNGKIAYKKCSEKLKQKQLVKKDFGDFENQIITNYTLDENLYIKILPSKKLIKVVEINIEHERIKDKM